VGDFDHLVLALGHLAEIDVLHRLCAGEKVNWPRGLSIWPGIALISASRA